MKLTDEQVYELVDTINLIIFSECQKDGLSIAATVVALTFHFCKSFDITPEQFKQMNYDQMLDAFPKYQALMPKFFDPQILWLQNANVLDFNNYTAEILRVARMFGVTQVNISVNNWTDSTDEVPSQRVIDFVQAQYADDYRLGRERGLLT